MSIVSLLNISVLNNPAPFTAPYEFEITFECVEPLKDGELQLTVLLRTPSSLLTTPRSGMEINLCRIFYIVSEPTDAYPPEQQDIDLVDDEEEYGAEEEQEDEGDEEDEADEEETDDIEVEGEEGEGENVEEDIDEEIEDEEEGDPEAEAEVEADVEGDIDAEADEGDDDDDDEEEEEGNDDNENNKN
ncbi:nucleosome assembly factor ASF1 [Sugiyamaella lignohabitans]|uniref:Anti-silencing function protein 1 n=1 Tax=Sugiyamaella lignohabitans TaxID=796027 RepID=A0A167FHG3_9ASCO|nr:nucleosome assembly factor ASF1 [Sugiyamaella lignohabitans]ANB15303.1 nucleosome assembly factor ASF1 [Sugiyamaella lignohabitans]